ncbi:YciI family protein [Actinokineospora sp. HUAS TT18]|uniref:YciI family protein n=1 Tax=Actinokineospora sp. HUAS TT18 TaxID=3447451 RepID=UPI003F524B31
MTWFTVDTTYIDDADRLAEVRPLHRAYLQTLVETGQVLAAGPWADGTGGFVVFKTLDRSELDRILAADPYTTEGIAAARTVREWTIALGPWAGQ